MPSAANGRFQKTPGNVNTSKLFHERVTYLNYREASQEGSSEPSHASCYCSLAGIHEDELCKKHYNNHPTQSENHWLGATGKFYIGHTVLGRY